MVDSEQRDAIRQRHQRARERALDGVTVAPWIDGADEAAADGSKTVETRDPAIDEPIASVPVCDAATVGHAVEAAWDAFDREWADTTPTERSRRLFEWVDVLRANAEELALLESLDTGKPRGDARGEVDGAIDTLEYYASIVRAQTGDQIPVGEDLHMYTRTEPFGVVGQVTPWNFPAWAAAWKLGPALAAGNCAVLKPSAHAPLTTIRMAQLSKDVLPDGVCNVVTGPGSETGNALVEHEDVRKVSFTGSGAIGTEVMQAAATRIAPVTLELGGKSPFIVFPDADLETVVEAVADGIYYSTGEICDALSRALVHEDVYEEFVNRFIERSESYVLGDPLDEATTMGPLTNADQFETVTDYIEVGQREGATLATGGEAPDDPALADGHYLEPTVFTDVDNDMRIAQEEIFGPVQTIQSFATYEEAIELANDTDFGLAAGIGTESTDLVHRAAADLEAGLVYVNAYGPIRSEGPYGGFKESGIGRDLGEEALDHYRQTKTVYVNLDEPAL
ncbi:MAG: aldehyde dehydrogenase [Haloglomus sp.]